MFHFFSLRWDLTLNFKLDRDKTKSLDVNKLKKTNRPLLFPAIKLLMLSVFFIIPWTATILMPWLGIGGENEDEFVFVLAGNIQDREVLSIPELIKGGLWRWHHFSEYNQRKQCQAKHVMCFFSQTTFLHQNFI